MILNSKILVLGAGVSGLSTAIVLMKKGYKVVIWAKDFPPNTTSNKAGAIWYPYLSYPKDKVVPWSKATYEYFLNEIIPDVASGCFVKKTLEIFDKPQSSPWWKEGFPGRIERPSRNELPKGYIDGYRIDSIIIDTSFYMTYLVKIFHKLGGAILKRDVKGIHETFHEYPVVVNCTGLGSRTLFNDTKLYPIRGQIIRIAGNDCEEALIDDSGPNSPGLVIPRINDIVLGGTAQAHNWNTAIDPKDTEEIIKRVKGVTHKLKDIKILGESIGLRPGRDSVRLETERYGKNIVIHNYGHGGSGFTLSWGCAQEVGELIETL